MEPDVARRTASVGKVLLLIAVARLIADDRLDPEMTTTRLPADAVADSGLWQHLRQQSLSVLDLAVLVGAISDNLATNVLLRLVGIASTAAVAELLDLEVTRLHDRVRDIRGPQDPPTLSTGTAAELAGLFGRLHRGRALGPAVSTRVLDWLNLDSDTSMVAGAFVSIRWRTLRQTGAAGWRTRPEQISAFEPMSGCCADRGVRWRMRCWLNSTTTAAARCWRKCGNGGFGSPTWPVDGLPGRPQLSVRSGPACSAVST